MIHALLLSVALSGQIIGPDEFPRDTAAEYGCKCAYPEDETDIELNVEYSSPSGKLNLYPHPEGKTTVYVVGPPGSYELKSDATVLVYETWEYLKPGPNWPDDPTDITKATRRTIKSYDTQNYSRPIKIFGDKPDPGDDDDDDDDDDCDDVPDDKWKVGKVACQSGQILPLGAKKVASEFVALYADVAEKVKRFELKTPAAVTAALKEGTDPILNSLSQSDADAWKMDWSTSVRSHMQSFTRPGMGDLPEYYKALSDGLRAVK